MTNGKPPHTPGPTAFLGGPVLRPTQQAARVVQVPAPAPKRTHQTEALLHVRLPNAVEMNAEALRVTGLRDDAPVELIPPRRGISSSWYLYCHPMAMARVCVEDSGNIGFKTKAILPRASFNRPPGDPRPSRSRLSFYIGEEVMEKVCVEDPATEYRASREVCGTRGTGYFRLIPVRA